jgi:hypothetical protein
MEESFSCSGKSKYLIFDFFIIGFLTYIHSYICSFIEYMFCGAFIPFYISFGFIIDDKKYIHILFISHIKMLI